MNAFPARCLRARERSTSGGGILDRSAIAIGLLAAAIAVGGFISRARAILLRHPAENVDRATVIGGVLGLLIALGLILLDTFAG
jgi:hypothetical protein